MRFGIHMPQKGGFARNLERAASIGCRTVQIFAGNPTGWQMAPLADSEIAARVSLLDNRGLFPLVVHAAYLVNLASASDEFLEKSRILLNQTMERAACYRAPYVVLHTGNHGGRGLDRGLDLVAESIAAGLPGWPGSVQLLLENTAGSGTALGSRFEELGAILQALPPDRLGVCFDTAHAWAAGHDISSPASTARVLAEFDRTVGLDRLKVIHANDTPVALGARVDRHAHIGAGAIGREGFTAFLGQTWPPGIPVILETPAAGTDMDRVNLQALTDLAP